MKKFVMAVMLLSGIVFAKKNNNYFKLVDDNTHTTWIDTTVIPSKNLVLTKDSNVILSTRYKTCLKTKPISCREQTFTYSVNFFNNIEKCKFDKVSLQAYNTKIPLGGEYDEELQACEEPSYYHSSQEFKKLLITYSRVRILQALNKH